MWAYGWIKWKLTQQFITRSIDGKTCLAFLKKGYYRTKFPSKKRRTI
jgi:hypothetical protein